MGKTCLICNNNKIDDKAGKAGAIMCDACWDAYIVPRVRDLLSSGSLGDKRTTKQCALCGDPLILSEEDSWKTMHPHCFNEYQNQQNPDDTRPKNENGEPICISCNKPLDEFDRAPDRKWVVRHRDCHSEHKASQGNKK